MIRRIARSIFSRKALPLWSLLVGVVIGLLPPYIHDQQCRHTYQFLNTLAACDMPFVVNKSEYDLLRQDIQSYLTSEKSVGELQEAGVYFVDLVNGPFFAINARMQFAPASLLKLPLAVAYMNLAEDEQHALTEQASVAQPEWSFTQYYPSSHSVDPTQPHRVEDLLASMLAYSDNNAYGVLQTHLYDINEQSYIPQTFLELGFTNPTTTEAQVLSVKQYADIFRALYNASYLNAADSEMLLSWMSESDFSKGLRADIPSSVTIAHKFGERSSDDGIKQLHDCGIIYYPGNPYLLCVMTRGDTFDELAKVIRHLSNAVYQEVDSRRTF